MWGTLPSRPGPSLRDRFIPTHVGNTSVPSSRSTRRTVHPHACGEHSSGIGRRQSGYGSSPRMWGTHEHACKNIQIRRFIPTHVGNTSLVRTPRSIPTVHPHACGEHRVGRRRLHPATGSSPRMWGTRCARQCRGVGERFIPTHVGNTTHMPPSSRGRTVHPHACGEHYGGLGEQAGENGSSPRMWGTRYEVRRHQVGVRFIPTHVGNTSFLSFPLPPPPVHPHACGEHLMVVSVN
ncbi:hypothetical protein Q066_06039 [Pseudomonas aeruginosa BL12]|nr:hypothetical protein Q066_06039 [Pseudomonas aeruginosa BL12]